MSTSRAVARSHALVASDPEIARIAAGIMPAGNAVDTVIASVFAAAALYPSVLFGPVQMLIGGAGAGVRAVDGRTRQPGLGVPRPRGFRADDKVPDAARVGVPVLPAALAAALATSGSFTFSKALAPAVELAKTRSPERRAFLKRLGQQGPSLLAQSEFGEEIVAAGGRIAGGLVTLEDLQKALPAIEACEAVRAAPFAGAPGYVRVPWGGSAVADATEDAMDASAVHAVAAADGRGMIAIAIYEVRPDGLVLEPLGLTAPFTAEPVRRGERRVNPGEPRPAAAPFALIAAAGGKSLTVDGALAITGSPLSERILGALLRRAATAPTLDAAIAAPRAPHEGSGDEATTLARDVGYATGVYRSSQLARALSDPRRAL